MYRLFVILFAVPHFGLTTRTSSFSSTQTFKVQITITNIRSKKGLIQIQVYRDQSSFLKEVPYKNIFISKSGVVQDGKMNYTISNLPADVYGLALLDDENSNRKMDYGLLLPTEGFGFSDYYHTGWSRPVFDDFKFKLYNDKHVTMKIRYV